MLSISDQSNLHKIITFKHLCKKLQLAYNTNMKAQVNHKCRVYTFPALSTSSLSAQRLKISNHILTRNRLQKLGFIKIILNTELHLHVVMLPENLVRSIYTLCLERVANGV